MTENEKLRALLAEARDACESLEFEPCSENRKHARGLKAQIDAALAEPVVDDFKRGAEAMREATAVHFERGIYVWAGYAMAHDIRALPIPEDK